MKITFLGTAGYHPTRRRHTSCIILPEVGVVLDAGTGMYRLNERIETDSLDIYLSHAHLDHVVGLTYLVELLLLKPDLTIRVHGDAACLGTVKTHLFAKALFPVLPDVQWCVYSSDLERTPRDGTLNTFALTHPGGSVGMRFDWPDLSLAYVTDTTATPTASYLQQIEQVDLLIHEANFPPGYEQQAELTGHSCLDQVIEVAQAVECKRLVLVHSDPHLGRDADFDLSPYAGEPFQPAWVADLETIEM